jgi:hypothetical protein
LEVWMGRRATPLGYTLTGNGNLKITAFSPCRKVKGHWAGLNAHSTNVAIVPIVPNNTYVFQIALVHRHDRWRLMGLMMSSQQVGQQCCGACTIHTT